MMKDNVKHMTVDQLDSVLGFNGESIDPVMAGYHLGNGYRTYIPSLRRFTSPDGMSPFQAGGINSYGYCEGDPINKIDPSGHHVKLLTFVDDVFGVGVAAFDVAAAVATGGESLAVIHAVSVVIAVGTEIASQASSPGSNAQHILDKISFSFSVGDTLTGVAIESKEIHHNIKNNGLKAGLDVFRKNTGNIRLTVKTLSYTSAVTSEVTEGVADGYAGDYDRKKLDTPLEKTSTYLGVAASITGFVDGIFDAPDNLIKSYTRIGKSRHHGIGYSGMPRFFGLDSGGAAIFSFDIEGE
ncbi:RHS repeat-associated core domain-containing protein [Pseudomonas sp. PDM25]|uniref:RHS repeat-associated core domain-containing protein n=1 Tax=Pseudomonas sp. PDM25 TaxID=2854772 RepID=UPI00210F4958|nr:RHS repeat-associated core domain-containing protein [Pseudomonas sp. PDM25]